MTGLDFMGAVITRTPFPHAKIPGIVGGDEALRILGLLEDASLWKLRVEDFYEQHEFSLLDADTPGELRAFASEDVVNGARTSMERLFGESLRLVDASVHRLTVGQTIRVHNDYLGDEETHRLLIQINAGWTPAWGGHLMLFGSDDPADVADVVAPISGSGFAFEISARSYHAVSTAHDGRRYTIVYTFRRA